MSMEALHRRWAALCAALRVEPAGGAALGDEVLQAWQRWPRRYHDCRHLQACVEAAAVTPARSPETVAWALWFHDAVYWPWRKDNEMRSARWACEAALALGLPDAFARRAHDLVMATAHGQTKVLEHDDDAQLVVDIDLGILGQPHPVYARYAADVRREYFWVLPRTWRRGRSAVLRHFLAQPAIYRTAAFRERFEATARANLEHELTSLGG